MSYIMILVGCVFVNNVVLSQFMGICPFLGVSKQVKSSVGMGGAVIFVMACAAAITYPVYKLLEKYEITYLKTVAFILVIAMFVQLVEIIMKKTMPPLHKALGVYLPLITTNCAVLGVTIGNIDNGYNPANMPSGNDNAVLLVMQGSENTATHRLSHNHRFVVQSPFLHLSAQSAHGVWTAYLLRFSRSPT